MDFFELETGAFEYGVAAEVLPGVERIIAENPSKFTYRGTGTYIVGGGDVAVIDPGPALDSHRDALATALEGRTVRAILITHCHADHSPLAAWLRTETGAPTSAYGAHGADGVDWDIGSLPDDFGRPPPQERGAAQADASADDSADDPGGDPAEEPKVEESTDTAFVPDIEVRSGDSVFSTDDLQMTAVHTPGHTSNHTCFALRGRGTGRVLFTGDHVMGWSTTVVAPPDGDMRAYMDSLRMVAGRRDDVAVPTHGVPIPSPRHFVGELVDHRLERERQVLGAVRSGSRTVPEIVTELYADVRIELHRPAGSSVLGHLVKLVDDGVITVESEGRARLDSVFRPV